MTAPEAAESLESRLGSQEWWQETLNGHNVISDMALAEFLSWASRLYLQAQGLPAREAHHLHQGILAKYFVMMERYAEPAARKQAEEGA